MPPDLVSLPLRFLDGSGPEYCTLGLVAVRKVTRQQSSVLNTNRTYSNVRTHAYCVRNTVDRMRMRAWPWPE